jgi:hypothetical protein
MKVSLVEVVVVGAVFSVVLAITTAAVVAFGFAIAYALTLMMNNIELRHAITPGAVFAGFSLYFCFRFITHTIKEREYSYLCDECSEKDKYDDEHATAIPMPFVLRGAGTKQPKRKAAHNKRVHGTGDKR